MLRNRLDIQLRNVCLIFRVYGWLQSLWTPWTAFAPPPWNPWNIQLSQGTGQGVSITFNAASWLRSLEDRRAALGSSRCELPGMHSVPKSAVLPYASGVGGLVDKKGLLWARCILSMGPYLVYAAQLVCIGIQARGPKEGPVVCIVDVHMSRKATGLYYIVIGYVQ